MIMKIKGNNILKSFGKVTSMLKTLSKSQYIPIVKGFIKTMVMTMLFTIPFLPAHTQDGSQTYRKKETKNI